MSLANRSRQAASLLQQQANWQVEYGNGRNAAQREAIWRTELGTETPIPPTVLTDPKYLAALERQRAAWQTEFGDENPDFFGALLRYAPGAIIAGETFTRSGTTATYFDSSGVLQATVANQKRDGHYIAGVRTTLMEGAATNIVLLPRDLTNVAWVHTTMTAAKDQVGIDGVPNSASSLLATGANSTSLQTIVLGSSTRAQQAWVKRITGSGVVNMTMDNGATWTAITVTASWARVTIPSQAAVVNPVVGFRIVTSGDKIAVDYVDNETGTFSTSPKIGTRSTEVYSIPFTALPQAMTVYLKFVEGGGISTANARLFEIGDAGATPPTAWAYSSGAVYRSYHQSAGTVVAIPGAAPLVGDTVEYAARYYANGSTDNLQSINGGATGTSSPSAANAFGAAWAPVAKLWIGQLNGAVAGFAAFQSVKVLPGVRTLAEMRAA